MAKKLLNPDNIRERTEKLRQKFTEVNIAVPDPSDDNVRISTAISEGGFGCRTEAVFRLVEAITGKTLVRASGEDGVVRPTKVGSLVVYDEHVYLTRTVDKDGDMEIFGSDMSTETHDEDSLILASENFRPASPSEVEEFLIEAGLIPEPTEG